MEFKKAERKQLKARISIVGASGHGKTRSALKVAYGLCPDWSKIFVIDTEYDSACIHVGTDWDGFEVGPFMHGSVEPPYTPKKFLHAIITAEQAGAEVVIIDTFTHEWEGEGGINDIHQDLGGQFHHWKEPKKMHNHLIERMMHSPLHIICTVRAKQEYVLEPNEKGKMEPRKVGVKPQQSNDYDSLFTSVFMMQNDEAYATVTKDRTHLFNGFYDQISVEHGQMLHDWLVKGKPVQSIAEQVHSAIQYILDTCRKQQDVKKMVNDKQVERRAKVPSWSASQILDLEQEIREITKSDLEQEDSEPTILSA